MNRRNWLALAALLAFASSSYLVSCGSSETTAADAGCSTALPCTVSTNVN